MLGIFDSGIGGLTFAKAFRQHFPKHDFVYFGDQLRVPYGNRSQEAIQQFTEECVQKLWTKGATLVIIACNTASAEALRYLQQKYPQKKILGVLIPGVEKAVEKPGSIGIIATKGTVATGAYEREIKKRGQGQRVFQVAAPLLVPFIEENMGESPECRKILRNYLRPLKHANVEKLILGCTHYPHIQKVFKKIMGPNVKIINPAEEAVQRLQSYLDRHPEVETRLTQNGVTQFFTSDCPQTFSEQGKIFYGSAFEAQKML